VGISRAFAAFAVDELDEPKLDDEVAEDPRIERTTSRYRRLWRRSRK